MRPQRRVTLAEVAKQAGVSRTTASFVTTNRKDMRISKDAERRVMLAAEKLGYEPNLTARSLRTAVTHTIGLISDSIATEPYAGELIHGALDAALQHGYLLLIAETEADAEVEARLVREMINRQVDAMVYASMFTRQLQAPASARGHPLVLLNCLTEPASAPAVIPDEINAGRTAARVLLEAGHHDGIYLIGERAPGVFAGRERVTGITEALEGANVQLAGGCECLWHPEPAYEAVTALLSAKHLPKALICLNDRIALGAYQALAEAGLRIPDDVSVVSFDNSDLASWLRPQLTSLALPHYRLGHQAVELLAAGDLEPNVYRVPMPLITRASVATPRRCRGQTATSASRKRPAPTPK
jgi:LacI family transcriptional regulator